jgi:ribosomal protein L24E
MLSGTPAAGTGGVYHLTLGATNGSSPDAVQTFTLTVDQAPAIRSSSSTTFRLGESGSFAVTTTGYPEPTISAAGALPHGVTLVNRHNGTGLLSGVPAATSGGTYEFTITASNGTGSTVAQAFTLTVAGPATCNQSLPSGTVVGMATSADGKGYWIASSTGRVAACGNAADLGQITRGLSSPVATIAGTPDGKGFWLSTSAGRVYAFGDAARHGDVSRIALNKPIVAMTADPATGGYWLLGSDGGVFSFDAPFFGSTGNDHLVKPAVGMVANSTGTGYWFVASDGGVFTFGHATFHGSAADFHLFKPVVSIARDSATGGYWLLAADGGVFSFGAPFYGSTGGVGLARPAVAMTDYGSGAGYRFVAADGKTFSFRAPWEGSASGSRRSPAADRPLM